MKIQIEPNSVIHMSGSYKEDCDGTITITNHEDYDVKFKVRTTMPHIVTIMPNSEVLSGNSSRKIDIHYQGQRTDQYLKFMVLYLSLEDIKDSDNVFEKYKDDVDQKPLSAAFVIKYNLDEEFLSPMARSHQSTDADDKDFGGNIRKKVPWLKKK
ncbi:uncharacterized protein LOC134693107 [Mytilus trossulus]|uniref:uncharacterized protein LOC134693107 n=1 Tax=Mytilus trossulus TaxID=6551 RepID=UPI00300481AB